MPMILQTTMITGRPWIDTRRVSGGFRGRVRLAADNVLRAQSPRIGDMSECLAATGRGSGAPATSGRTHPASFAAPFAERIEDSAGIV